MSIIPRRILSTVILLALVSLMLTAPLYAQEIVRPPVRDKNHRFARRVASWSERKERNIVMQDRDYSCGAAVLATIAKYYWGDDVDEEYFLEVLATILTREEQADRVENGLSMADLRRAAVKSGYQSVVGKLTYEKLTESKVPLIVGITVDEHDHFVVYRGSFENWVYLADPIRGNLRISPQKFLDQWQENAVLAVHKPGKKVKTRSALSVRDEEIRLGDTNRQLIRTLPSRIQNKVPRRVPR